MKQFKIFMFFFFVVFLQVSSFALAREKIDDLINNFIKQNDVKGMSIAFINKDKTSIYNYGYANEVKKVLTTDDTLYRINSFTKTFTATLTGIAQIEGKLKLEEPFINYFPEVKKNKNIGNITIAELLAHVASTPNVFAPSPKNFSDLVSMLNHYKPPVPVGTEYKYSNYSIGIVGYVLQNAYKKAYEELLNNKIFSPLHMASTYLNIPAEQEKNEALGHDKNNNLVPIKKEISVLFAAGELKSTITDMAKYLSAQIGVENLTEQTLREGINLTHKIKFCFENTSICQQLAWQEHVLDDLHKSTGDTLGVYKVLKNNQNMPLKMRTFIDKTGGGAGMSSYMAYIPTEQKGVVILINKDLGDGRVALGRQILGLLE